MIESFVIVNLHQSAVQEVTLNYLVFSSFCRTHFASNNNLDFNRDFLSKKTFRHFALLRSVESALNYNW